MGYHLPESNDYNLLRACIGVPVDKYHRAAFMGQIQELTRWWAWEKDPSHAAIDAAGVWLNIIENDLSIGERCDPLACSNGITLEIDPDDTTPWGNGTLHDIVTYNCPSGGVDVYMARSFFIGVNPAYMAFRLRKGGLTVGGSFPTIRIMTSAQNVSNVITVSRLDCLGNTVTETTSPGADEFELHDRQAKKFFIQSFDDFVVVITIPHELDCTPS